MWLPHKQLDWSSFTTQKQMWYIGNENRCFGPSNKNRKEPNIDGTQPASVGPGVSFSTTETLVCGTQS